MDALDRAITDKQLRDWMTYFSVEPWGSEISWAQIGTIAAMIGNAAPNRKRGAKTFKPADFMPKFGTPKRKPGLDPKKVKATLFAAFGSRIVDKRKKKGGADGGGSKD